MKKKHPEFPVFESESNAIRRDALRKLGLELQGPIVPRSFEDNGCSVPIPPRPRWLHERLQKVADGRWRHACRIHDYEYQGLRALTPGTRLWKNLRYQADTNLAANIRTISRSEIENPFRRLGFVWIARAYFLAVRFGGRRPATGLQWRKAKWYRRILSPLRKKGL